MKRFAFLLIIIAFVFSSCNKDEPSIEQEVDQTLFMYLPWASNLLSYFYTNIEDMEKAIETGILKNERVVVFFSTSESEASLFELKYQNGKCVRHNIRDYTNPPFTTAEGISSILNEVISYAPAKRYAMAINCHGMAWVPVQRTSQLRSDSMEKEYWEYDNAIQTRWFGGVTTEYQTDISTFAEGIQRSGVKMEYIMFDDCYMSSIEVAYDLKDVTDHIIASPCEVLAHGMPYDRVGQYMVGKVDYAFLSEIYIDFYKNYEIMPCGTIATINCNELDNLAAVMREINRKHTFDESLRATLQRMDGYSPTRFFDYGDYVTKLCGDDTELLEKFNAQYERTVPSSSRKHTEYFYTMSSGKIKINTYSGVTTSDPSISPYTSAKNETSWHRATN